MQEAKILEVCKHPNIPHFYEVYQTYKGPPKNKRTLNIVMEYAENGDLYDLIKRQKESG